MIWILWIGVFSSCIHDHPFEVSVPGHGNGGTDVEDPYEEGNLDTYLEVSFDLNWENLLHRVEFSTKASPANPHRFLIETRYNGDVVSHETTYLTDLEFEEGVLRYKIPVALRPDIHQVSVWYDCRNEAGSYLYEAGDLSQVKLLDRSTTDASRLICAYASDIIDLREYNGKGSSSVLKTLEMKIASAAFEIVATDVNQFIELNKEALLQGDSFSTRIKLEEGAYPGFNLYSGNPEFIGEDFELSGRMRLPFAEYDELKIAEGILFCNEEDEVTANMVVLNSALTTVSRTDSFVFPVKRGYITTIRGNFLTHPVDGLFTVDNIWEGEIIIDL